MESVEKRYYQVDVMRFVCAILVITIHTSALYSVGLVPGMSLSLVIARIAVPFFFITSGYFFYERFNTKGYTKKYLKRISSIYLITSLIYTILIFSFIKNKNNSIDLLIKNFLFNGISPSLWFLPALILSIGLVAIFLKRNWIKPLILLSIILYFIGLIGDSYYGLIVGTPLENIVDIYSNIFVNTRNGLCFGVPFITIGILINKYNLSDKIKSLKILTLLFSVVFAFEGCMLIIKGIPKDNNMYISLLFLVPCIFLLSLKSKKVLTERKSKLLRDMSLWIYCLHELIQGMIYTFFPGITRNSLFTFIVVTTLVIPISYIIVRKKAPFYPMYKKKEFRVMASLIICALVFGVIGNGGISKAASSSNINPAFDLKIDENATSSNIVGPMWKISNGDSTLYLYGSSDIGRKDMYPLSPKVEEAFKNSEAIVLEAEADKMDSNKINSMLLYENGETIEDHVSKEAVDIYKEKVKYFNANYDKIKQIKPGYLAQDCIYVYLTKSNATPTYTPVRYFLYMARKTDKPTIELGNIYELCKNVVDCPDEVGDASLKLLKYYDEDAVNKDLARFETWKTGDLKAIEEGYNDIYTVPDSEKDNFNKLTTIVNNYNNPINSSLKKEYSEKIDGFIKDKKNYFVSVSMTYFLGDDSIIKNLEERGYTVEKIN